MTNEYHQYLEQYNKIVSNKLKIKGVYELIELWNKTQDKLRILSKLTPSHKIKGNK
jgi:hypothetical protein